MAKPLIAVTVGTSLSLTSRVRVGHLTLRHIQARRSTRHYGVGGFHFLYFTSRALRFTGWLRLDDCFADCDTKPEGKEQERSEKEDTKVIVHLDALTSSERSKISLLFVAKVFFSFVAEARRAHLGGVLMLTVTTISETLCAF